MEHGPLLDGGRPDAEIAQPSESPESSCARITRISLESNAGIRGPHQERFASERSIGGGRQGPAFANLHLMPETPNPKSEVAVLAQARRFLAARFDRKSQLGIGLTITVTFCALAIWALSG